MAVIKRLVPILLVALVAFLAAAHGAFLLVARGASGMIGPPIPNRLAIRFRIDAEFTPTERVLILEAFRLIRLESGCIELTASFEPIGFGEILTWRRDDRATIHRGASHATWKRQMADYLAGPGSYMGIAMVTTGDLFIMASAADGPDDFRNTMVHEVLHVLFQSGWHSQDPKSLMYHSIGEGNQKLLGPEKAMLRHLCGASRYSGFIPHGKLVSHRHLDVHPASFPGGKRSLVQQTGEARP
jgi:hypothetical protein